MNNLYFVSALIFESNFRSGLQLMKCFIMKGGCLCDIGESKEKLGYLLILDRSKAIVVNEIDIS